MTKHRVTQELPIMLGFVALLWGIFMVDWVLPFVDLNQFGLRPRTLSGLIGVFTMPFLHGSFGHLFGNSIPLLVLLCLLAGSRANSIPTVVAIAGLGGALLWCMGRSGSTHIGASGLVFGLAAFLIASGFFERRIVSIIIAIVVGFLYGGTLLWGVLPTVGSTVSWDGHLFGAIAGIAVAFVATRKPAKDESELRL